SRGDLAVGAVIEGVKKMSKCVGPAYSPPCITARRGGCVINEFREATETDAAGVVFLFCCQLENHPGLAAADASRHFIDRSATPPCGGARRGICRSHTFRHLPRLQADRPKFI